MANTYTTGLKLAKPGLNDAGWGTTVNDRLTDLVDQAVVGSVDVAVTSGGTTTLPAIADGASSDARNMTLVITGSLTSVQTATVRVPATVSGIAKLYSVTNSAGGTVTVETSGGASVAVPNGKSMLLRVTSAGVYEAVNYAFSLTLGTALPATSGGTGQSSYAVGDLLYASSTTAISKLTVGATNAVLTVAAGIPSWTTTLPVASGGTGAATLAANNVLLGNDTSAVQTVAPGTAGNVLTSNGTTWQSTAPAAGYVGPTTQVFSSNGTFTIPSGITKVKVTLVGGGGGTAGAPTNGEVLAGGGGATAIKWLTSLTSGNTISVTVGSGGTASGSSGVAGGAGGNSSIASGTQSITTVTANGGAGGGVSGVGSPGSGGTATNGDLNMSGSSGTTSAIAGFSIFSTPVYSHVAGNAIGGGGGGRVGGAGSSSSGVAGAAGIVIFEW